MKLSGGVSFTYIQEDLDGVTNGVVAFTITVDPDEGDITIVDSNGNHYISDNH